MSNSTLILDQPHQIERYRLLATLRGLEMEIRWGPRSTPTKGMALGSAQRILAQYNVQGPRKTRRQCHASMLALCQVVLGPEIQSRLEAT